jgi:hypothetical protein
MKPARLIAFMAALAAMNQPVRAEETVRYFGSGWPIALAEAACGGDEGCLTKLANCGPGTDGTCTTQVARCSESRNGVQSFESLCTVYLMTGIAGNMVALRLPDGDGVIWVKPPDEITNAVRAPASDAPPVCYTPKEHTQCFTHIIDTPTLSRWANGQESE